MDSDTKYRAGPVVVIENIVFAPHCSAPNPTGGAHRALPESLAAFKGAYF